MVTTVQSFQTGSGDICEMGNQRISVVSNQANGNEKSDGFVVDIKGFSHFVEKDLSPNSRITWQRNLSRKGSLSGASAENRTCSSLTSNEKDRSLVLVATSSPKASTVVESNMNEPVLKSAAEHSINSPNHHHHQITVTTGNIGNNNAAESKWNNRRSYSFRRPPPTWIADPRKILFFFATLSSMGTLLLIFLTLSMRRTGVESGSIE